MAPSTKFYSSLFTAGLYSLGNHSATNHSTTNTQSQPSISLRPPLTPTRKSDPSPRRRRKSSAAMGSSPMAAIKGPSHRAQYAHRASQKSNNILVNGPAAVLFPDMPENRSLTRRLGGRPPPSQKPAPLAPLPTLPPIAATGEQQPRPPLFARRDSETLPLPSPGLLSTFPRAAEPPSPAETSYTFGSLLAPSPVIGHFSRQRSSSIVEERDEEVNAVQDA